MKDKEIDKAIAKELKQYYKFILTTPNSWVQFLPIGIYDKKLVFDFSMFLLWLFFILTMLLVQRILR